MEWQEHACIVAGATAWGSIASVARQESMC
jgi:hypothetical protein